MENLTVHTDNYDHNDDSNQKSEINHEYSFDGDQLQYKFHHMDVSRYQ